MDIVSWKSDEVSNQIDPTTKLKTGFDKKVINKSELYSYKKAINKNSSNIWILIIIVRQDATLWRIDSSKYIQFIVLFQNLNIMACYANIADTPMNDLKTDRTTIAV